MKIKFEVKPEVIEQINEEADLLGLFDPNFKDDLEVQGSGYHAFRYLVLTKTEIPEGLNMNDTQSVYKYAPSDVYRAFQSIHAKTRPFAYRIVLKLRKHLKIIK